MKRDKFLRIIGENGVEVEEAQYKIDDVNYRFMKLHAPWTLLAKTFGKEDNPSIFASAAERSKAVYEVLIQASAALECKSYARTGLDCLIHDNTFTAAYPLHDGPYDAKEVRPKTTGCMTTISQFFNIGGRQLYRYSNERAILYSEWATLNNWMNSQPIDNIRKYFGERVAFYFAWTGFYTFSLLLPVVMGVAVILYGVTTVFTNPIIDEICNKFGKSVNE